MLSEVLTLPRAFLPEYVVDVMAYAFVGDGVWSAVTTLVTIAGPLLGGFLADAGLWRGIFLINIPLGIGALLVRAERVL